MFPHVRKKTKKHVTFNECDFNECEYGFPCGWESINIIIIILICCIYIEIQAVIHRYLESNSKQTKG